MPKAIWPKPLSAPLIRKAVAADLPAIMAIENEQFSNPWQLEYYAAELANSFSHFYVAEDAGSNSLIGFMLFWRLGGELELHKIAVAEAWQRRGHASHLLEFFVQTARSWQCDHAVLEVRAHNNNAIRLYEKFAFRLVGRRREYYTQPMEDALLYELEFKERAPVKKSPVLS
jgi:ribosomal-protein-alanine N-acetyltransferase